MSRFSIITYIALFCFSSLIAQELCIPSELEATSGNRSIFFSWKDILREITKYQGKLFLKYHDRTIFNKSNGVIHSVH